MPVTVLIIVVHQECYHGLFGPSARIRTTLLRDRT